MNLNDRRDYLKFKYLITLMPMTTYKLANTLNFFEAFKITSRGKIKINIARSNWDNQLSITTWLVIQLHRCPIIIVTMEINFPFFFSFSLL